MAPKQFTYEQVAKHNKSSDCYMVIDGGVYDITEFLAEHPGGEEVLLDLAGEDGSDAFDDVGHSEEARAMMEQYKVGTIKGGASAKKPVSKSAGGNGKGETGFLSLKFLVPVAIIGAALFYKYYYSKL